MSALEERKIEKVEIDSAGELAKDIIKIDNWVQGKNIDIIETKPKKIKTEKIEIVNTGNFLEIRDGIVNIPLELIVFPFFTTRKSDREVNFEYKFNDMGFTMYSNLSSAKIEGKDILQPGTFEKKVFDFVITKFEDKNDDTDFISFDIKSFIVNFLGNKMNDRYYTKIEDALRNMKYTTYSLVVRNNKKAGNFSFESPTFNLLNYEKVKKGKSIFYKVFLDKNIVTKIKQKRYIKFKMHELSVLEKKDSAALRIYQYISMRRFQNREGAYRAELLAAIIPLKTFATQRKKMKDGTIKEYRVSMLRQVLKRIEKAFKILVDLKYLDSYEIEELKEVKSFNIKFIFGGEGFHVSDMIDNKKRPIELKENLNKALLKAKKNIFFAKKYNKDIDGKLLIISKKHGEKIACEILDRIYKNLKIDIRTNLTAYIDGVLKNYLSEKRVEDRSNVTKIENSEGINIKEELILEAKIVGNEKIEENKNSKNRVVDSLEKDESLKAFDIIYKTSSSEDKIKIDKVALEILSAEEGMSLKIIESLKNREGIYNQMMTPFRIKAIQKIYG